MILPSKKIVSVFILTAALVASIIIAFGKDKSSTVINMASNLGAGEKVSLPENPNWQNELGGVNVNTETVQIKDETPKNTTDIVSESLISNYLTLKQSGNLTSESAQKLIDQSINYVSQNVPLVTVSKLNIIADNGAKSMADYGENLGNILKNNKPRQEKNEIEIINRALESRDEEKIKELDSIIVVYEKIGNEFANMPVPQTFVKAHIDMTNGMLGMASSLKEMRFVFGDPFKGLSSLQLYGEEATKFIGAIKATGSFLNQNNIVYKQGSGGYYLLYGI